MSGRRIDAFFYGLFMDAEALRAKGLDPRDPRPAHVTGMALRLGERAALVERPERIAYGVVMALTHAEIAQL